MNLKTLRMHELLAGMLGYRNREILTEKRSLTEYAIHVRYDGKFTEFNCTQKDVYEPIARHYGVQLTRLKGLEVSTRYGDYEFQAGVRPWLAEYQGRKVFHRDAGMAVALAVTGMRI